MADVKSTIQEWSSTPSENKPLGTDPIGTGLDDNLREIQSVVRKLYDTNTMAAGALTDLSLLPERNIVVTGTGVTITGLGTLSAGIEKRLFFTGTNTITHNATSLICPNGLSFGVANNTVVEVTSQGSGNWIVTNVTGSPDAVDATPVNGATTTPISSDWAYDHNAATTGVHGVTGTVLGTEDVDDVPVNGATTAPVSSNWAYDHNAATTGVHGVTGTVVGTEDVDNTPVNGATTAPISSDWAYMVANETMTIAGAKTFSGAVTVSGLVTANASQVINGYLDLNGEIREEQYTLTGTTVDPANGTVQYKSLSANTTLALSFGDGESVYLRLANASTYAVTWPTITWTNGDTPPSLSNNCAVILWRQSSVYYGAFVGTFV